MDRAANYLCLRRPPISALGLALFRIAYGAILFGEVAQLIEFRELVLQESPYLLFRESRLEYALWFWQGALVCLICGLFTRAACAVNFAMTLLTFSTFANYEYHADHIYIGLNLLLLFTPIEKRLSLDRFRGQSARNGHRETGEQSDLVSPWHYDTLILVGLGLVYFDSVFWKVDQQLWRDGLGVWLPASFPNNTWLPTDVLQPVLDQSELVKFASHLTLVFEAVFLPLMWWRRARPFLIAVGLSLHVGILLVFPIPFFALSFLAIYLLLVPPEWFESLLRMIRKRDSSNDTFGDLAAYHVGRVDRTRATSVELTSREPQDTAMTPAGRDLPLLAKAAIVVFMVVIQAFLIAKTPWLDAAIAGEGTARRWHEGRTWQRVEKWAHAFTGVSSHPVFLDYHFAGYDRVVAVVHVDADGKESWLPLTTPQGQPGDYVSGRIWARWMFRANGTEIVPESFVLRLRTFTAYWARREGIDLNDARFKVLVKKYDPRSGWEPGYLSRQGDKPWQDAGYVYWRGPNFTAQLNDIESM